LFAAVAAAVIVAGSLASLHARPYAASRGRRVARGAVAVPTPVFLPGSLPWRVEVATPPDLGDHAPVRRIRHVVLIFQENHTFDNVLGLLCVRYHRCNGASTGRLADGRTIKLQRASDVVPEVIHEPFWQRTAIDHGRMDGFSKIPGCTAYASPAYRCYSQFDRRQIPNLWRLARAFTISDATFSDGAVPSFGSHLDLVAQTLDGFTGATPLNRVGNGPEWDATAAGKTGGGPDPTSRSDSSRPACRGTP
jgi:phospholipase C